MALRMGDQVDDEMKHHDQGMTILEVVIAITIFLIGVGFIAQSNGVAQRYRARQELRQQMIFYAAGQLETAIENKEVLSETTAPFKDFTTQFTYSPTNDEMNDKANWKNGLPLQEIKVIVTSNNYSDIQPVSIKTYRVWATTP